MTFAKKVKEELNSIQIKNNCCKKAYLLGVSISAHTAGENIVVKVSDNTTAEKVCYLLNSVFKCSPCVTPIKRGCFESTEICFKSKKIADFLLFADKYESGAPTNEFFSCVGCKSAFIRGLFCACGTVSDPIKSYSLELRTANTARAEFVRSVISEWNIIIPSVTKRKNNIGLFYRNESAIEDFLTACGGNKSLFSFYDALVEKNVRNAENRATNCVTRNISKSVSATALQISAIESLISAKIMDDMPKELKATAVLRLQNPDINLTELASIHIPPISKSGLNHRLNKIVDEAKKRKLI